MQLEIMRHMTKNLPSVEKFKYSHIHIEKFKYHTTPIIRINWDHDPSKHAQNSDNWIFL
jgi:hypothetical protein